MSEWFQTIVDIDATEAQAPALAAATLGWLVKENIVQEVETDCVLAGVGHAPGRDYASIVTVPDPHLHTLRTNGLRVITERTVFWSMGIEQITCPHCASVTRFTIDHGGPDENWEEVSKIIGIWYDTGDAAHSCPSCRRLVLLNDWRWQPEWGFGYLGFQFWNWPPITDDFVATLSSRLGHRTVRPSGKL